MGCSGRSFQILRICAWMVLASALTGASPPAAAQTSGTDLRSRRQLEEYLLRARPNGIPKAALTRAVEQMRAMPGPPANAKVKWTSLGPAPVAQGQTFGANCEQTSTADVSGRVTAIAFGSGQELYVGSAHGGVWVQTISGMKPLMDNVGTNVASTAVGALAVVPGAGGLATDILYVGSGEGNGGCDDEYGQRIFKSIDGGQHFQQLALGTFDKLSFTKIVTAFDPVTPNNPTTLYATTVNGVVSSASGTCLPISTTTTPGVYQSIDHGEHWQQLHTGGLPDGPGSDVTVPQSLALCGGTTGVAGFPPETWDGTVTDGMGGMAMLSLDPAQINASGLLITPVPDSPGKMSIDGTLFLTQTPPAGAPGGVADDFSGQYTCTGGADSPLTGPVILTCLGGASVQFLTTTAGAFALQPNHQTGTFSGTWMMSADTGEQVTGGTFNFDGMPQVVAGVGGNGLYTSTDGGLTWTNSLAGSAARWALDMSANGSTVYAAAATSFTSFGGVFASTDGGHTFTQTDNGMADLCANEGQYSYNLAIAIDPASLSTVVMGIKEPYLSTDGGVSFFPIGDGGGGVHSDHHAVKIANGKIYAGNDGGIFTSADRGNTWDASLNDSLAITQFQAVAVPPTGNALTGGTQDNGTETFSGSPPWVMAVGGDGGYTQIDQQDPTNWFSTAGGAIVQLSQSSGARGSYTSIGPDFHGTPDPMTSYPPSTEDPTDGNRLILGTNRIWESCDTNTPGELTCDATGEKNFGDTIWIPISTDPTGGCTGTDARCITDVAIAPSAPAVMYAVTGGGRFWGSTDSKCLASPTSVPPVTCHFTELTADLTSAGLVAGTPLTSVAVSPTKPGLVLVTASGFTRRHAFLCNFKRKANRCHDITRNIPDIPALSGIFDQCSPNNSLLVGTDIGVFHFRGGRWHNSGKGSRPNVPVYMLRQNNDELVAATHGRGMWSVSGCPVP